MAKDTQFAKASDGKAKPRGGEEIKAALLAAADLLFGLKGPDAVSVRDIAAQADLIPPLIHRYFGAKDELIRQVLQGHVATFREAGSQPNARAVVGSMFDIMADNPAFLRIIAYLLLAGHAPEEYLFKSGGVANLASSLTDVYGDDAKLEAAILTSQMMGWLLFEPFLLYVADYDGDTLVARGKVIERLRASVPQPAPKRRRRATPKQSAD